MREDRVKIIVATHKKYRMPDDPMYIPLHVGAEGKKDAEGKELDLGFVKDNTGDNISFLNASFCELTGLYWAWKNLDADYIGLVHYRRHFGFSKSEDPFEGVLKYAELQPCLDNVKIFLPNKRRYYIETLYGHYAHTHYAEQLDETRKIIVERHPAYLNSFDKVVKQRSGYMFNMMIMQREQFNCYCEWLFDILFELRGKIDESQLSPFQGRFYGRVSEIIFNVWLNRQRETGNLSDNEIMEIPCIYMEKINWWKKGTAFMKAKFIGRKYEGSF
ncbi:MAG: DUF4422 domain-containing protein [Clostridiales bacterium]|nr:DUF4422 domain-containing protein [Clostridiales bacterium]